METKHSKLRIVPFNPTKKRRIELGTLAKVIKGRFESQAGDLQEQMTIKIRNMMLRRLYHLAYKTSPLYTRFPISLSESANKEGLHYVRQSCLYWSVESAYEEVKAFLENEGFTVKVEKIRDKDAPSEDYYYDFKITVSGTL